MAIRVSNASAKNLPSALAGRVAAVTEINRSSKLPANNFVQAIQAFSCSPDQPAITASGRVPAMFREFQKRPVSPSESSEAHASVTFQAFGGTAATR